ncbi:MAG: DegT/DnrJ/EryC1/StrS family aminotransferase [Verrucomicrobia bacterium]|nr:DegT/DnrJ/EryC1/StrS family aminotransferase [Verrucomicrobiota bacterium]MBU1733693.1 DegT/DnrJ/EryC1/StrS family aminotransferase [Verrucomicrobiota bacterium]MBU1858062.1 DegT/DnrJ/EryC1/StrS family aminotransferase [Verrucomicrobiota bacterium]
MKKILRRTVKPAVRLALQGGPKVRNTPWPTRHLIGFEEKSAVDALFDRAIASGNAFGYNGPEEETYCREFADAMGGGFADAVNSGTTAVYVALRALNIEPFSEVIVGPITDPGGIMPIPLLNCIPVIADAAPGRFSPGPKEIEAVITPQTSAIVVAHIFGEPADMPGIMKVARRHKLSVVEDCAQSHGARLKGRLVGTFGDIAAFSTMFGKHHCTGGQGGVVFTRHEKLYWEARRASDRGKPFGLPKGASNAIASLNFNLSDLAAVMGSVQLRKLPIIVSRRRELASRIVKGLRGLKAVSLPPQVAGAEPSYWYLRLRFHPEAVTCDKATFCSALGAEGLQVSERYCNPCHIWDWYRRRRVFGTSGLPWTAPQYRGNPNRTFPCPNVLTALDAHFHLTLFESWGNQEAADIVAIFQKVTRAFEKRR